MSIRIANLSKSFENKEVLSSINLNAKSGDIVGILGPNGAGKSTLMKIISGFYKQTHGTVHICGKNTLENSLFTKKRIGYLAEENPLYSEMYVQEFLEFICDIHKINYDNCNKMIDLTRIQSVKGKKLCCWCFCRRPSL